MFNPEFKKFMNTNADKIKFKISQIFEYDHPPLCFEVVSEGGFEKYIVELTTDWPVVGQTGKIRWERVGSANKPLFIVDNENKPDHMPENLAGFDKHEMFIMDAKEKFYYFHLKKAE